MIIKYFYHFLSFYPHKNGKGEDVEKEVIDGVKFPYPNIEKNTQIEKENDVKIEVSKQENNDSSVTPKYKILHRGFFDMTDFTGGR